ncbi:probable G-protein coupled receptor 139 [Saccostrea cucullata]|uniref:probable G-protein coupled receptor 139 n=1 Tax=Saccostrea cuccullata TaxID=36930 RepID=UPI002ED41B29
MMSPQLEHQNQSQYNISHDTIPDYDIDCLEIINGSVFYNPCLCIQEPNLTVPVEENPGYLTIFSILAPIISAIGIIGIILTIIVLSRKSLCTSTNCYLIALSAADLGFLVFLFPRFFERFLTDERDGFLFGIVFNYTRIPLTTFLSASVWINVVLAAERYVAIVHPLRANMICSIRRARFVIIAVFLYSFVIRIPYFFENKVETVRHEPECGGPTVTYSHTAPWLFVDPKEKEIYRWVVDCTLSAILPFLFLLILNTRLIYEIRASTRYIRNNVGLDHSMQRVLSNEQLKISVMLVCLIIIFFVCEAPYVVMNAFLYKSNFDRHTFYILLYIAIFLMPLKSTFNFILYCWFSERFWETLKQKLCFTLCNKGRRSFSTSRTSNFSGVLMTSNGSKRRHDLPEHVV